MPQKDKDSLDEQPRIDTKDELIRAQQLRIRELEGQIKMVKQFASVIMELAEESSK